MSPLIFDVKTNLLMKSVLLALVIASISNGAMAYTCSFTIENLGDDDHFGDWFHLRVKTDAKGKSEVWFSGLEFSPELGDVKIQRRSQFDKKSDRFIYDYATTRGSMKFRFVSDKYLTGIPAGTYEAAVNVEVFCGLHPND